MDPRDGEFEVGSQRGGERLLAALRTFRPALSWSKLRDLVARGFVSVNGVRATHEAQPLAAGDRVRIHVGRAAGSRAVTQPREPGPTPRLVHVDPELVVVEKPSGVPTVPFVEEGARTGPAAEATLDALVRAALGGGALHVVQRLDRDTSGLLVFARRPDAERALAQQLRFHTMHRRYLALVHGAARPQRIESYLGEDRGDGRRGSVSDPRLGKRAVTHVSVVELLPQATLVACRLETGRTHQIRIHLAENGHMVLGERAYTRDHAGPVLPAPRICLHAAELGFRHPRDGREVRFRSELPADFAAVLAGLRSPGRQDLPTGSGPRP